MRGHHADDRLVEPEAAGAAVELRVAVGEDAAVGGHQPVAAAVGRRRHADHGLVQTDAPRAAVECASPKLNTPPSVATSQ